jgi:hypothetical protein
LSLAISFLITSTMAIKDFTTLEYASFHPPAAEYGKTWPSSVTPQIFSHL